MQYNTLIQNIQADIYSNGAELITGDILQSVLLQMVGAWAGAGAMYGGVITPASAAPADLDQATVYLALEAGTYTNFVDSNNDPIVTAGPALITYDGGASLVFSKTDLPAGGGGSNYVTITSSTTDVVIPGDQSDRDAINLLISYAYDNNGSTTYYLGILSFATSDLHDQAPLLQTLRTDSGGEIGSWLVGVISGSGEVFIQPNDINSGDVEVNIYDMDGVQLEVRQSGDADYPTASDFNDVELSDTTTLEQTADKVSTLSGNETSTTKYPNTKAVVDAIGKMGVISQTQTWSGTGSNPRTYTIDPASIVRGLIPQANIDLFEASGATFNESTGYFELNGLTDISYEEMKAIYADTIGLRPIATVRSNNLTNVFARTNIPFISVSSLSVSLTQLAYANTIIEVVAFNGTQLSSTTMQSAFTSCYRLKSITGIINATATNIGAVFDNCFSLVDLQMKGIKSSVSFKHSSVLSKDSLLYLINNEASTSAITITLHASVYAKCQTGGEWYSDISTALSNHPNVSLASA